MRGKSGGTEWEEPVRQLAEKLQLSRLYWNIEKQVIHAD
jgi:hypothetical protein